MKSFLEKAVTLLMTLFQIVVWCIAAPIQYMNDWWESLFTKDNRATEERMMEFYERKEEDK